ncbi:MAG TPA: ribonuclease P protein component [Microbacteriaceae bacterium]|nr:ribonuclease P protein component [Microbacteriaceae bacterium]
MHRSRITRGEDFQKIIRKGIRVGGEYVVTHAVFSSNEDKTRFGFVVSKRVGNAVQRNLIKRRLTGITYEVPEDLVTGLDIVFRAKPESLTASYAELKQDVIRQLSKIKSRVKL